jgi:hypothetical protein
MEGAGACPPLSRSRNDFPETKSGAWPGGREISPEDFSLCLVSATDCAYVGRIDLVVELCFSVRRRASDDLPAQSRSWTLSRIRRGKSFNVTD